MSKQKIGGTTTGLRRAGCRRGRGADEDGLLVPATSNSGDEVLGEGEQRGSRDEDEQERRG